MKSIGEIIKALKKSNPAIAKLPDFDLQETWDKAMDETIKSVATVDKFDNGCLYLVVKDSVWLTELSLLKKNLIDSLNDVLKKEVVLDIKFKAGALKSNETKKKQIIKEIPLPPEIEEEVKKSLEEIDNQEVKRCLENIFKKAYSRTKNIKDGDF
ncbi:MAG: hypothetical protein OHK0040_13860 [bacterium]